MRELSCVGMRLTIRLDGLTALRLSGLHELPINLEGCHIVHPYSR
jgi:hypothetical protein